MSRIRRTALFSIFLYILAVPTSAYAAVVINEIDWTGTGANANAEWIELFNSGSAAVSLAGWALAAADGSPNISLQGSISAGGFFLLERTNDDSVPGIAADQIYSGALGNSGETLVLRDASGTSIDQAAGGSNWQNLGGDNTTKQTAARTVSGWVSAQGTPRAANQNGIVSDLISGESNSNSSKQDDADADEDLESSASNSTEKASAPPLAPPIEIDLGGDRTVEAGAGTFFEGHAYNTQGVPFTRARYIWNFGNGETREGQTIFYSYPYPGVYVLMLSVDAGNGYSAVTRATVEVIEPEVSLSSQSDGSLIVRNESHAKNDLDIGLWALMRGGKIFTIPKGTIILPETAVRFAPTLLDLPQGDATLLFPNGNVAARSEVVSDAHASGIEYVSSLHTATNLSSISSVPQKEYVSSVREAADAATLAPPEGQMAAVAESGGGLPIAMPFLGLASLILLGVAGVMYSQQSGSTPVKTGKGRALDADALAEEFTLVERPRA